jgi:hypothetical protein
VLQQRIRVAATGVARLAEITQVRAELGFGLKARVILVLAERMQRQAFIVDVSDAPRLLVSLEFQNFEPLATFFANSTSSPPTEKQK